MWRVSVFFVLLAVVWGVGCVMFIDPKDFLTVIYYGRYIYAFLGVALAICILDIMIH